MKKNAMLKIAAILMVAVLLTTCAISSTFAKYVTTASGAAEARVAKWGVTATVTTTGAFAESYTKDNEEVVKSSVSGKNVIAPGTKADDAIVIEFAGQPEVDTAITLEAGTDKKYFALTGWTDGCPLVFTVVVDNNTSAAQTIKGTAATIEKDLNDALKNAFATTSFNANANVAKKVAISWAWDYEVTDDTKTENVNEKTQRDELDTKLGNLCADGDPSNDPTVSFDFSAVIYQVGSNYATKTTEAPSTAD